MQNMTDKIDELLRRVEAFRPKAAAELEEFRVRVPVSYTHLTLPTN